MCLYFPTQLEFKIIPNLEMRPDHGMITLKTFLITWFSLYSRLICFRKAGPNDLTSSKHHYKQIPYVLVLSSNRPFLHMGPPTVNHIQICVHHKPVNPGRKLLCQSSAFSCCPVPPLFIPNILPSRSTLHPCCKAWNE